MRVNSLARRLTLTDVQKTNATAIFTDAYTASQGPQASLEGTRQTLSDAVKKNETASIDQLSATLGALTGQVTAINSKAEAAFYLILTPDQQAKYDTMPQRGLRGPGGPRGPGGGAGPSRMRRARGQ
jgi:Spy/CpxP family protein refolding chaperone